MKNLRLFSDLESRPTARFFSDFDREFDKLFNLYTPRKMNSEDWERLEGNFTPTFDLLDRDSHYVMSFDVPGVKKGDVKVEVNDGILTVEGERKFEHREGDYVERRSGHFKRMVRLPDGVEYDDVEANFEDGVLSVAIPKAEKSRPKKITISEGKKTGVWSRLLGLGQTSKEASTERDNIEAG